MSFREKSAWITFFTVLVFTGLWFGHLLHIELLRGHEDNPMLWFFGTLAALIALEVGLHLAIAIQSPRDARTPKDERERLIDIKASRVAFYVLLVGAFASIGTLHIAGANRFTMANCLMGSILIALLARFGTQIVLHRRDA
jgi:Predicted membrane protein (DUF2178)